MRAIHTSPPSGEGVEGGKATTILWPLGLRPGVLIVVNKFLAKIKIRDKIKSSQIINNLDHDHGQNIHLTLTIGNI